MKNRPGTENENHDDKRRSKMIKAGVAGATGYAGAELIRLLAGHPGAEIAIATSRQHAGARFSDVYPALKGHVDIVCEKYDPDRICEAADVVFTALPHGISMNIVPELIKRGVKVIDLSADFRFSDISLYENICYGK